MSGEPRVLLRARTEADGWTDPWGLACEAIVVTEVIEVWLDDDKVPRDDGYELRLDEVWSDTSGYRRFQAARNYVDMWGGIRWIELDDDNRPLPVDRSLDLWSEPKPRRRYIIDGQPAFLGVDIPAP